MSTLIRRLSRWLQCPPIWGKGQYLSILHHDFPEETCNALEVRRLQMKNIERLLRF